MPPRVRRRGTFIWVLIHPAFDALEVSHHLPAVKKRLTRKVLVPLESNPAEAVAMQKGRQTHTTCMTQTHLSIIPVSLALQEPNAAIQPIGGILVSVIAARLEDFNLIE